MSFDEIFDLTAGVYFNFYNIYIFPHKIKVVRSTAVGSCLSLKYVS